MGATAARPAPAPDAALTRRASARTSRRADASREERSTTAAAVRGRGAAARGPHRRGARPRLRGPVLAADRAPRARVRRVLRAAPAPRARSRRSSAARPRGLILSGGPASVYADGAPKLRPELLELGIPVLGICYGMQAMVLELGGRVEGAEVGEFGRSQPHGPQPGGCCADMPAEQCCWMSHRDTVYEAPPGLHRARVVDRVAGRGARGRRARPLRDPVPPRGRAHARTAPQILETLPARHLRLRHGVDARRRWSRSRSPGSASRWATASVICGLSGGVDSSVAALLDHRAVGDQLTCVFVDHGLMRKNEGDQVVAAFRDQFKVPLVAVDAEERFLDAAGRGRPSPSASARSSARSSSACSRRRRDRLGNPRYLVQGTLYSDVIESGGGTGAATIKSHHNVGGLPEDLQFELVEPLRTLFKDEVRQVGAELGLPERLVWRQPFPGPGLAIRIVGGEVDEGAARDPARRRLDPPGRDPRRRPLPRAVAVVLRAARRPAHVGRAGRRAHLRLRGGDPRGHQRRRDDRRLGPPAVRPAGADRLADDQRDRAGEPGDARHHVEAARAPSSGSRPASRPRFRSHSSEGPSFPVAISPRRRWSLSRSSSGS